MDEIVSYWVEMSDYDFETAMAMQKKQGVIYMLDLCVINLLKKY